MEAGEPMIIANSSSDCESGFALPSILMLITILALVSFSVLALQYLQRQQARMEVAAVKAEYAAQSGIAKILSVAVQSEAERQYTFDDGSEAQVKIQPWGMFALATSEGKYKKARSIRVALAGARMTSEYRSALLFGNSSHQLVFTGTASIKGDVIAGEPGITTGTMQDYITPVRMPVNGNIRKEKSPTLPEIDESQRKIFFSFYENMLSGTRKSNDAQTSVVRPAIDAAGTFILESVSDSVDYVLLSGNISLEGQLIRRLRPLYIIIDGNGTLRRNTSVQGLIAMAASGEITVERGAVMDDCVIISQKSIRLMQSATVSGQCISPSIIIDSGAVMRYPSLMMSIPAKMSAGKGREIVLRGDAKVEGSIILLSSVNAPSNEDIITINHNSIVTGFVRSDNLMTLDGNVSGMVHAKDFYFYRSPTKYFGWLRSGKIDRTELPPGYLLPPFLMSKPQYEVLEWL
ncbi:MAG: hypothetical protein ABSB78_09940 [Bacteroidota bacterium]